MNKDRLYHFQHFTMALIGGFLGAYSLMNHHDLFGNAQTTNLIYLVIDLLGHDLTSFLLRVLDLMVYILGFTCAVLIPKFTKWDLKRCSIFVNMITGITLCLIPTSVNDFIALTPIFFATSFQWSSFRTVDGMSISTIFSTNNLRQFTTSLLEYAFGKDKQHLKTAKLYGCTLLFFYTGVALSFPLDLWFGNKAGWFCIVPCCFSLWISVLLDIEKEDAACCYHTASPFSSIKSSQQSN